MPESIQLQLLGALHNNQRLFSDHYLHYILPEQWHNLKDEAAQVMAQLQQHYCRFTPNASNEAQTEEDWIKPALHALGHNFEVQAPLKVPDGIQRPDYIFYRDTAALVSNKNKVVDAENLQHSAVAVGDAKSWDRPLDKALKENSRGGDAFNNKNPSFQIFFYMLYSGLPWGILTNGRKWRLYHIQTAHKLEVFYEVDLPALIESNNVEAFLYFYAFFRRNAFDAGPLSLDRILTTSTEYAQGLSESLREQVYDALRYVAQGFLDYTDNALPQTAEETYRDLVTHTPDRVSQLIAALRAFVGPSQMMAYLVMITIRLVELHRVLESTGSLYLHCDPTAHHKRRSDTQPERSLLHGSLQRPTGVELDASRRKCLL